ncbi:hypothetical protein B0H11DRAFT_1910516 [Mycena galericulata]|nr:hypothetical protein B0H11DRAFT_1910516 [Mycena galericulata]
MTCTSRSFTLEMGCCGRRPGRLGLSAPDPDRCAELTARRGGPLRGAIPSPGRPAVGLFRSRRKKSDSAGFEPGNRSNHSFIQALGEGLNASALIQPGRPSSRAEKFPAEAQNVQEWLLKYTICEPGGPGGRRKASAETKTKVGGGLTQRGSINLTQSPDSNFGGKGKLTPFVDSSTWLDKSEAVSESQRRRQVLDQIDGFQGRTQEAQDSDSSSKTQEAQDSDSSPTLLLPTLSLRQCYSSTSNVGNSLRAASRCPRRFRSSPMIQGTETRVVILFRSPCGPSPTPRSPIFTGDSDAESAAGNAGKRGQNPNWERGNVMLRHRSVTEIRVTVTPVPIDPDYDPLLVVENFYFVNTHLFLAR